MLSSKVGKTTKIIVCGMKGTGKTTILEQLIYGNITEKSELPSTIEDIYVCNIETDRGLKEKVRFYDTAGIELAQTSSAQQQLPRQYLGFADGYALVYDTGNPKSLDILLALKKDIDKNKDKKEVTIIVIGNKKTTNDDSQVEATLNKASAWCAREKIRHFIANAYQRSSLYEPFVYLTSKLSPPPSKTTFPQLSMGRRVLKTDN